MRSTALLALLPCLATLATTSAHPHQAKHSHHDDHHPSSKVRKSLSFGPSHSHAQYEVLSEPFVAAASLTGDVDPKVIGAQWIADKVGGEEGVSFYLRPDVSRYSLDTGLYTHDRPIPTLAPLSPTSMPGSSSTA